MSGFIVSMLSTDCCVDVVKHCVQAARADQVTSVWERETGGENNSAERSVSNRRSLLLFPGLCYSRLW